MSSHLRTVTFLLFVLGSTAGSLFGESPTGATWPQWRGTQRNGTVSTSTAWPSSVDEKHFVENWSVPLGPSYSGPIVAEDRVFVTETKDSKYEVVRALERTTGKQIWETQWEVSMTVPFFAAANGSWIRATPAYYGERLFVAGMRDVLVCLDASSGEVLWKRDFVADTGSKLQQFGFASSPLVVEDHIYVQAGGGFAKLDKLTGKTVWTTLADGGGMYGSAFSSPIFATLAGVPQLVVQTRSSLAGVDPADGAVLWSTEVEAFRGMNILTPTVIGNSVFTSSYGGRSTMLNIAKLLIQASPAKFELISNREVADDSWAHLAVVDEHVFIRDVKAMNVYTWK